MMKGIQIHHVINGSDNRQYLIATPISWRGTQCHTRM
jgi:hypothetical protein